MDLAEALTHLAQCNSVQCLFSNLLEAGKTVVTVCACILLCLCPAPLYWVQLQMKLHVIRFSIYAAVFFTIYMEWEYVRTLGSNMQ